MNEPLLQAVHTVQHACLLWFVLCNTGNLLALICTSKDELGIAKVLQASSLSSGNLSLLALPVSLALSQ